MDTQAFALEPAVTIEPSPAGLFPRSTEKPTVVLSFGAGQDSWALLLMALFDRGFRERHIGDANFIVVFSDTENEYPETYDGLDQAKQLCATWGVPFYHLRGTDGYHSPGWSGGIEGQMAAHDTIIMITKRSCTDGTKVAPIYMFLDVLLGQFYGFTHGFKRGLYAYTERFGKVPVMLGYSRGEEKRAERASKIERELELEREALERQIPLVTGMPEPKKKAERHVWMRLCVKRVYPLIELGMDRKACQKYCEDRGFTIWPSNCMMCPHASEDDILLLSLEHPDVFERWCAYEDAKLRRFAGEAKNLGVKGERRLRDVAAAQREIYRDLTDPEVIDLLRKRRYSRGHCVNSSH